MSRDSLPTQVERFFDKVSLPYDRVFTNFMAVPSAASRVTSPDPAVHSGMAILDPEAVLHDIEVICEGSIQSAAIKSLKQINDPLEWRLSVLKFHMPAKPHERALQLEQLVKRVRRGEHLELRMNRPLTIADLLSYER